ncbi:MAG: metallothionein [Verrucomicrobiota bacterium]
MAEKTIDEYLRVCSGICTMSDATATVCACPDCKCEVSDGHQVIVDGKNYCCDACANGHPSGGSGCCDGACACRG